MVRKGHFAHGKLKVCELFDLRRDAERRADQKAGAGPPAAFRLPQRICQLLRGQQLPLRRQDAEKAALRELRADKLRFFLQALRNLRVVRVLRQTALRQLDELEIAIGPQALGVFRRGLGIEALFQLSHTDERDGKHKTSANPKSLSATDRLLDEKLSLLRRAAGRSDGRA